MASGRSKSKTILGLDPSTVSTGWAIFKNKKLIACGTIKPDKKLNEQQKLALVFEQVNEVIKKYKPDAVACEDQFAKTNVHTLKVLSRLVGVILLACETNNIEAILIPPTRAKNAFTKDGHADKKAVIAKVKELFGKDVSSDEADAIAIAYTLILNQSTEGSSQLEEARA